MTEKKYLKELGKRISEKREALGLSAQELAEKIDLSKVHVYRIEAGEHSTNILILRRIAKIFRIGLEDLVTFKER